MAPLPEGEVPQHTDEDILGSLAPVTPSYFKGGKAVKLTLRGKKKTNPQERKETHVLWLTINKCHVSFQSRGLLIFATVTFNYPQRAVLKSFRKRSQTFTTQDMKLRLWVSAFNSCSSHVEEQLKGDVRAGLMPGLTSNLWDTVPTRACPSLEAV